MGSSYYGRDSAAIRLGLRPGDPRHLAQRDSGIAWDPARKTSCLGSNRDMVRKSKGLVAISQAFQPPHCHHWLAKGLKTLRNPKSYEAARPFADADQPAADVEGPGGQDHRHLQMPARMFDSHRFLDRCSRT